MAQTHKGRQHLVRPVVPHAQQPGIRTCNGKSQVGRANLPRSCGRSIKSPTTSQRSWSTRLRHALSIPPEVILRRPSLHGSESPNRRPASITARPQAPSRSGRGFGKSVEIAGTFWCPADPEPPKTAIRKRAVFAHGLEEACQAGREPLAMARFRGLQKMYSDCKRHGWP
jgi:hypothetical protein